MSNYAYSWVLAERRKDGYIEISSGKELDLCIKLGLIERRMLMEGFELVAKEFSEKHTFIHLTGGTSGDVYYIIFWGIPHQVPWVDPRSEDCC